MCALCVGGRSAPGWWFSGVTAMWVEGVGVGDYGWSGVSRAWKILLGDIVCSSFR